MTIILYNAFKRKSITHIKVCDFMKRCAVINDISGFGKCSLAVQIPILSSLGIEVHPAPTAVLSNQTAYGSYCSHDMSDFLEPCFEQWKKLSARFDAVLTGYFASAREVKTVMQCFADTDALFVVDPVMGDDGELYNGMTGSLCKEIKELACRADVITPNLTELRQLTGEEDTRKAANIMLESGNKAVVLTGVQESGMIGSTVYTKNEQRTFLSPKRGGYFSGTGDIFAAVLTGKMLAGSSVFEAARFAGDFISDVIAETNTEDPQNGVDFEKKLGDLV